MDAAAAVADLLERSGMSKTELSSKSGVSRSLIDDYLKARRQPSMAQLARLGEAAGLRLDIFWNDTPVELETEVDRTPHWARPNPAMDPLPLSVEERAEVLVRVVAVAMEMRRRPRGELEFPPFRTLAHARADR